MKNKEDIVYNDGIVFLSMKKIIIDNDNKDNDNNEMIIYCQSKEWEPFLELWYFSKFKLFVILVYSIYNPNRIV